MEPSLPASRRNARGDALRAVAAGSAGHPVPAEPIRPLRRGRECFIIETMKLISFYVKTKRKASPAFRPPAVVRGRIGARARKSAAVAVAGLVLAMAPIRAEEAPLYLAVDLRGGRTAATWPVDRVGALPAGGRWGEEFKTGRLLLRRIEAGTFAMGSPEGERGRYGDETLHSVTIGRPYYIGVFEVTQRQWELAMGHRTSPAPGDTRPADCVSHASIRGARAGAAWPESGEVDADSFMGVLRAKTGLDFDLPTEAQWEYACRAGTRTALNSGRDLSDAVTCPALAEIARCPLNTRDGRGGGGQHNTGVGEYRPNAWGLHDMHGNVWEWCLDWYAPYPAGAATDPAGPAVGTTRVLRGGSWGFPARDHRSARRHGAPPGYDAYSGYGFRVACPASAGDAAGREAAP